MDGRLSTLGGIDMTVGKGSNAVKADGDWIKKTDADVYAILGMEGDGDDENE